MFIFNEQTSLRKEINNHTTQKFVLHFHLHLYSMVVQVRCLEKTPLICLGLLCITWLCLRYILCELPLKFLPHNIFYRCLLIPLFVWSLFSKTILNILTSWIYFTALKVKCYPRKCGGYCPKISRSRRGNLLTVLCWCDLKPSVAHRYNIKKKSCRFCSIVRLLGFTFHCFCRGNAVCWTQFLKWNRMESF